MFIRLFLPFLLIVTAACAPKWRMVPGHISTEWAAKVSPKNAWREYPRPQMTRPNWQCLNGLWDYAITPKQANKPGHWQGKILVPFPVESALSGVKKPLSEEQKLWYRTHFSTPKSWHGRRVLLHFEAADWETEVWINGKSLGKHLGGYDPFSFDISEAMVSGENELVVSVFDPTDAGTQPTGKQTLKPGGVYYTPTSGIWQTVWLEPVSASHIVDFQVITDIDKGEIRILPNVKVEDKKAQVTAEVFFQGNAVGKASAAVGAGISMPIPNAKLWSPGTPNLYDLKLKIEQNGQVLDEVAGYFGMRKIALGKDKDGFTKMLLNNRFVFQNGPLDQGFWPDGLYTPPSDEAMRFDLEMTQKMGFNMLRKHVKVEPRRFYYWCDRMGLLVWQDMPNGDHKINLGDPDFARSKASADQFELELSRMISSHFNHPSIVVWVPFNEGWGQYETGRIGDFVKKLDPTRLVNPASGWSDRGTGEVLDWHNYPNPNCPPSEEKRAVVVGEFGGLGLKIEGHMWENGNWGYANYNDAALLMLDYEKYYTEIWECQQSRGLSAAVYTQTTDVETEANGLISYDRRVVKHDPADLFRINSWQFLPAPSIEPMGGMFNLGDSIGLKSRDGSEIRYTLDGSDPTEKSPLYRAPLRFEKNAQLRARAFSSGKSSRGVQANFELTTKPCPRYRYPFHEKYRAGYNFALIDGKTGSEQFADGVWQGFLSKDLEVTFELEAARSLSSVSAGFHENTGVWIFLPKKWTVFTSLDGKNFEKAGEMTFEQPTENRPARTERRIIEFKAREARFVKIQAENLALCPDWHPGKGQACWIFADEVVWK